MSSACSPSALKEMTLRQLLEIREKLLSPDNQAAINRLPVEQQHEINLLISLAQINYLKLQRLPLEQISQDIERIDQELLSGIENLTRPINDVASVGQFTRHATGFVSIIESCFKTTPSSP